MKCKHLWMFINFLHKKQIDWCENCGTLRITEWKDWRLIGKPRRTYYKPEEK